MRKSHDIAFPHSPQNFMGWGKVRVAMRADGSGRGFGSRFTFTGAVGPELPNYFVDLRQHPRQFLLQADLGLLIIGVGKLADAILELQIAQVLIDGRAALVQMPRGR